MEELSRKFKAGEINENQLKEAARDLIKGYGKDIGIDFEVVYLDEDTMPKDSKGSTGAAYKGENGKILIPIDVSKIEDINNLFGTITEEISHGKDALEGRQDKKAAEDKKNKEKGLESLGRPANDYVKNKLGEDNNSKISLTTGGELTTVPLLTDGTNKQGMVNKLGKEPLDVEKAPGLATISDEKLTSFQNEVSKAGTKLDLKTGELIGPKGGKGKVVGTTPDGKVVANMAERNVIFENGKQNTISAGSFKKFEIPKTNEVVEVPTEVITKNNTKKVSENMFNGFLDKAKSKITGKPVAQVQLERIGIKSEVKDIGLKVDGTSKTGLDIDEALDNNLGRTFKTYDNYDKPTKTATSVKSVDMTSKTYTDGSGLSSKLNDDLKAIKDFTEYKLKTVKLENKDIENRILKIVINNEPLNKSQMENLKKVVEHATENGIKVEAVILK